MAREIITVNVGQAGVQLGQRIWRQYNAEHFITKYVSSIHFSSKKKKSSKIQNVFLRKHFFVFQPDSQIKKCMIKTNALKPFMRKQKKDTYLETSQFC